MKIYSLLITFLLMLSNSLAQPQSELPFKEITETPADYTEGAIVARMIDGLGYRYYWASKNLNQKDLDHTPTEGNRTTLETLQHIYDLSVTIKNVAIQQPNMRPYKKNMLNYEALREQTLYNLKEAREAFLQSNKIDQHDILFQREGKQTQFPFWNFLNGPLADAIYHTGQIVVFRRMSGNPIHPKVNVFTGQNAE